MGEVEPFELVRHPLRMRRLAVAAVDRPTPRLARLTLAGDDLDGFCSLAPDDHVKVFIPSADGQLVLPELGPDGMRREPHVVYSPARDYTPIPDDGRLVLDVVLHGGGVASTWAQRARVGDTVGVAGPRGSFVPGVTFDRVVLLGDETALPAIKRWLRSVDPETEVDAIVEIADPAEQQVIDLPTGATVRWLHRNDDDSPAVSLADALGDLDLDVEARMLVWAAGEASAIKAVRDVARAAGVDQLFVRTRGYWKAGNPDHQEPHDD